MTSFGKVEKYLQDKRERQGYILLSLIDPPSQTAEQAGKRAKESEEGGADIILIGGSASAQGEILDMAIKRVKENTSLPTILFPGNIGTTSKYADAIWFMSLLNSRNPYWISQAQALGAPVVKKYGIEAIPTAYLVIEPGEAVGYIGDVNPLPRNKPYIAAQYAMAGEMLGMRVILTDSGSGAPSPPENSFISIVRKALRPETLYIYAGGCRTTEQAAGLIKSGANGIQIGTAFENSGDVKGKVSSFRDAMRKEGRKLV